MKKSLFVLCTVITVIALFSSSMLPAQTTPSYWSLGGNSNATSASKLGTTSDVSLRFYTNNVQRMIINSAAGYVGIGTGSPVNILTVKSSGGTPAGVWLTGLNSPIFMGFAEGVSSELVLASASNTTNRRSVFQGRRSRGTLSLPTILLNNDYITSLLASGYDGSSFQNPASIDFYVDGTPVPGTLPARISFVTGSNAGNRLERLKIGSTGNFNFNSGQVYLQQSNGNVGIGTTTPENKLHLFKGSAGAVTGWKDAPLIVENSVNSYINILAPDAAATGVIFGKPASNLSGGIFYNDISHNPNGFDFRTNGNITQMVLNNAGRLGIGTLSPGAKLHVSNGSAGAVTGYIYAPLVVENSTHSYINILAPDATETGILFGKPASNTSGGIIYNNSDNRNGFEFRTNNNITQMVLTDKGNLGVGTIDPGNYKLKLRTNSGEGGLALEDASSGENWSLGASIDQWGSLPLSLYYNDILRGTFVNGNGVYTSISDERLKTNIKPMTAILDKIRQLKPSTYQFKNTTDKQEYNGFIAQDVMKVFPAMVTHNVNKARNLDVYTMDYSGFGAIAVKGIQELQPIIEEQKEKIATLEDAYKLKIATLEERIVKLEAVLATITANNNRNISNTINNGSLEQNKPNPFNKSTIIRYSIPQSSKGQIHIYDQTGKLVKAFNANESGQSELSGYNLAPGTYTYTLMVNGKVSSSKQMLIIK